MSSEDPFGGLFGDPDELRRRMAEFAEQMQGAQRVAWADNAIKLAVDMTVAGLQRMNLQGNAEQQAQDLLQAMRLIFPEAVILVREAREGFGADLADCPSCSPSQVVEERGRVERRGRAQRTGALKPGALSSSRGVGERHRGQAVDVRAAHHARARGAVQRARQRDDRELAARRGPRSAPREQRDRLGEQAAQRRAQRQGEPRHHVGQQRGEPRRTARRCVAVSSEVTVRVRVWWGTVITSPDG